MPPRLFAQDGMKKRTFIIHGPNNFTYHFNQTMKGGRAYARCYSYYKRHCTAAISFHLETGDCKETGHHNHPPHMFLEQERLLRHTLLQRSRNKADRTHLQDIYNEEVLRMRTPDAAIANLPFVKIRRSMERARREGWPELPRSLSELANLLVDDETKFLSQSCDEVDNIFAGVTGNTRLNTRCVLLFSQRQRRYLNSGRVRRVFSDSTFIAPVRSGVAQILNLVTLRRVRSHPHIIPLGSILMQSKRTDCYVAALSAVQMMCPNFRPTEVICDFEQAEQAGWAAVYPNAERHGCFFHHTKDVSEKAKELGLRPLVRHNNVADSIVRSLCAVPLLRRENIVDGVLSVVERAQQNGLNQLAPLFDYYNRTWLIPSRLRVLSVHGCQFRTSNACESYNASLYRQAKRDKPNIFQLLDACVRLEYICKNDHTILNSGNNASVKRRHSALANDQIIQGLTEDLEEGEIDVGTFLRRASRRVQGVYDLILHPNQALQDILQAEDDH
ncbi:putative dual-specificity RNA methyltransferase 3 [Frankliniella fusca]|uniref:Dual-specificity RNA methyltransferase 3 n=1 Tax=Frankliniella fusca TaxID=407009 RepID=A0AAE1GRS3_9NEOP|nr:putative dual-specificity RNA methyltransferase 3 [Frankliniella fusca]